MSRALYEAGLFHIAHKGFSVIVSHPPRANTLSAQTSAAECLATIQSKIPSLLDARKSVLYASESLTEAALQLALQEIDQTPLTKKFSENFKTGLLLKDFY